MCGHVDRKSLNLSVISSEIMVPGEQLGKSVNLIYFFLHSCGKKTDS